MTILNNSEVEELSRSKTIYREIWDELDKGLGDKCILIEVEYSKVTAKLNSFRSAMSKRGLEKKYIAIRTGKGIKIRHRENNEK